MLSARVVLVLLVAFTGCASEPVASEWEVRAIHEDFRELQRVSWAKPGEEEAAREAATRLEHKLRVIENRYDERRRARELAR